VFFPIGDAPNPRNFRAWVTWAIIVANVLVYVLVTLPLSAQEASRNDPRIGDYVEMLRHSGLDRGTVGEALGQLSVYDLFVFQHGFRPADPSFADLFSSLFLHAGFLHLAGNMFFLWIYGDNVEHRVGRIAYFLLYVLTGVAATIGFALLDLDSQLPLVGASGAISGVLGLYFVLFPRNRVKVFVALFPFLMDTFLVPARLVLGIFVVIDNLFPFLFGSHSGVAYGAHLGGFVAGAAFAALGNTFDWGARDPETGARVAVRGRAVGHSSDRARWRLEMALRHLRQGQHAAAYQDLRAVLDLDPDPETEATARRALEAFEFRGRGFRG
jgi:membrane associated rhomboid family serine protease